MRSNRACMICGGRVHISLWLCSRCAEMHGLVGVRFRDWPAWAKALKRCHEAERRAELRRLRYEADIPIEVAEASADIDGRAM